MPPSSTPRGTPVVRYLLVGVLILAGVTATFAALVATGKIELPFLKNKTFTPPPGTIPVPVTAQKIPAYTRLTRDHFWDGNRGQFSVIYLRPDQVPDGVITNLFDLLNRVLATDKSKGYAVTEKELLPKGSRPGLAGGTPPGKRSVVLEANKIVGIHGLRNGDHLDLVASVPQDSRRTPGFRGRNPLLALRNGSTLGNTAGTKQAKVAILAQDAVLVSAVTTRQVPQTTGSLTQGTRVTLTPVQEVVIAVDPEEVPRITEALAVEATITAVAHSGRADAKKTSLKQLPPPPKPRITVVETIRGKKRTTVIFAEDGSKVSENPGSPEKTVVAGTGQ